MPVTRVLVQYSLNPTYEATNSKCQSLKLKSRNEQENVDDFLWIRTIATHPGHTLEDGGKLVTLRFE